MPPLTITTWNVLHRIHAMNFRDPVVDAHPVEAARIAAISAQVCAWLADAGAVVCLQEVSGDQLASLRASVAPTVTVVTHTSPRVPALRGAWFGRRGPVPARLADRSEQLVTLVADPRGARRLDAQTFLEDRGKGLLAVQTADAIVVNAHLSFRARRTRQLDRVADAMRERPGLVVAAGDFNVELARVRAAFGGAFSYVELAREPLCTHPGRGRERKNIDHVVALRGVVGDGRVLDGRGLSDHNPVVAQVVPHGA